MEETIGEVLVVDSDERVQLLLKQYLERQGLQVVSKLTVESGWEYFKKNNVSMLISEIVMPKTSDFELLTAVRNISNIPVLILSTQITDSSRIQSFKKGADDFVGKPFSSEEVYLRMKRLLKYYYSNEQFKIIGNQYIFSFMSVNKREKLVTVNHKIVNLSNKEYDLLLYLIQHQEEVLTREVLLKEVWHYNYFGEERTVDTYIKKLRKKLGEYSPYAAKSIVTEWKRGYRFNPNV